jgi:hypothetical protein
MAIDPSIILSGRPPVPVQTPDPLENYAKIMGVKNAMQQGQLGQLQLSQAEKAARDEEAYGEAFKATGGNFDKLLPELANRGLPKQYLDVQQKILGNKEKESVIGKNTADASLTQQKVIGEVVTRGRDQLATINDPRTAAAWTAAQFNDPIMGPILKSQGATPEQKIAEIPTDPVKFQEWKTTHILNAEKLVAHLDEQRKQIENERNNKEQNRASMISAGASASQASTAAGRLALERETANRPVFSEGMSAFVTRPDAQGNARVIAPVDASGKPIPNRKNQEDADNLRKEFAALPEVKSYKEVVPIIRSATKAPNTSQGDIDLIYAMGKVMDPNSVVREGEMNMVVKSGSPEERVAGYINYLRGGGRLSPAARQNMMNVLNNRVGELENSYKSARSTYEGITSKRGYQPGDVFVDLPATGASTTPAARQAPAAVKIKGDDGYNALPSGARYVGPDGVERIKP